MCSMCCARSEEHTSELQSRPHLVCRLLLEKKKIGLATSDAEETMATPRRTLRRTSDDAVVAEIARFAREEEIGLLVVGITRSPEGVDSPIAGRIRIFASNLAAGSGLEVRFHEETLTSDEARRRLPPVAFRNKEPIPRATLFPYTTLFR